MEQFWENKEHMLLDCGISQYLKGHNGKKDSADQLQNTLHIAQTPHKVHWLTGSVPSALFFHVFKIKFIQNKYKTKSVH